MGMVLLDRLLIAAAILLGGTAAFLIFRQYHLRRATAALAALRAAGEGEETSATSQTPAAGERPAGRPALLYFRSDACVPCVAQARFVRQIQVDFGDQVVVVKVDTDKDLTVAERYGVFTLPTTLIVDSSGQVRHANYGLTDARRLASQLNALD